MRNCTAKRGFSRGARRINVNPLIVVGDVGKLVDHRLIHGDPLGDTGFLADLGFWLRHFGTNLDPTAPLSSSIDPFVPPVLGRGWVGQFATDALPDQGLILATIASLVILVGLVLHRRAYKPLADAARDGATGADA